MLYCDGKLRIAAKLGIVWLAKHVKFKVDKITLHFQVGLIANNCDVINNDAYDLSDSLVFIFFYFFLFFCNVALDLDFVESKKSC